MKKRVKATPVTPFVLSRQNHLQFVLVLVVCTISVKCIRVHEHNGENSTTELAVTSTIEPQYDSTTFPSTSSTTSSTIGTTDETINESIIESSSESKHSYEVSEEHEEDGPPLLMATMSSIQSNKTQQETSVKPLSSKTEFSPSPEITHFNNVDNFYPTTGRLHQSKVSSNSSSPNPTLPSNASSRYLHQQHIKASTQQQPPLSLDSRRPVQFHGSNQMKPIVNWNHIESTKKHKTNQSVEHHVASENRRPNALISNFREPGTVRFPEEQQHAFDTNVPVHTSFSYKNKFLVNEAGALRQHHPNVLSFTSGPIKEGQLGSYNHHQIHGDVLEVPTTELTDERAKILNDNKQILKESVKHFALTSSDHPYEFEHNEAYQFNTQESLEFSKEHEVIPNLSTANPLHQPYIPTEDWHSHYPHGHAPSIGELPHKYLHSYPGYKPDQKATWKKMIHILSAIIPIGLAISALNPRVIYVSPNSTTQFTPPPMPINLASSTNSQLQSGASYKHEEFSLGAPDAFKVIHFGENDRICVTKRYCDLLRAGNDLESSFLKDNLRRAAMAEFAKDYKKLDGLNELLKALESEQHCFKLVCGD